MGSSFGGRYKAIAVQHQEGPYFRQLIDYVHLNPVRAGLVDKGEGFDAYEWSSLREYRKPPSKRFEWMETRRSMDRLQIKDTPAGRRNYLERLEALTDWSKSNEAGRVLWEGQSLQSTLKRGWYFGEQAFRNRLLEMLENKDQDNAGVPSRSIAGDFRQGKGDEVGHKIIEAGLKYFDLSQNDLPTLRKGDERKSIIAGLITENTNLPLKWIAENLHTGSPGYTSHLAIRANRLAAANKRMMKIGSEIVESFS